MENAPLSRSIVVVGAGPGIGLATARRFAAEGYAVGLVARDAVRLAEHEQTLKEHDARVETATADATSPDSLRAALETLADRLGAPEVVCYCPLPSIPLIKPVLETSPEDLTEALALGVAGLATVVRTVTPAMRAAGRGTVLVTSGSGALRPSPERAASAVATSALTSYAAIAHEALATDGVHLAHVAVVGAVGPGRAHEPDAVADELWTRHVRRDQGATVLE